MVNIFPLLFHASKVHKNEGTRLTHYHYSTVAVVEGVCSLNRRFIRSIIQPLGELILITGLAKHQSKCRHKVLLTALRKAQEGFLPPFFRYFFKLKAIAAISMTLWAPVSPSTPIFLKPWY